MPSPPSKILFVITTTDFGGSESFLEQLTARLDPRRFLPIVCSLCPPGRVGERIAERGIALYSSNMSDRAKVFEMLRGIRWLADVIDTHSVDVVHSILYRANVLSAVAARLSRTGPRVVSNQRSLNPMGDSRSAAWSARLTRRFADRVLAVSDAVKQHIVAREGLAPSAVKVVYGGVDSDLFSPGNRPRARSALDCGAETLLIGGVGRFSPEKGFEVLVRAAHRLRRSTPDFRLLLIGDGVERARLEGLVRELDLSGSVQFLGVRQDLPEILPALDIVVIPSLEEGLPMLLLEAMACGSAVIASSVGGIPEVIEDGQSGLLVSPGSESTLAEALERLAANPALCRSLGSGGRRRVEAEFRLQDMVTRYEHEYVSLLEKR